MCLIVTEKEGIREFAQGHDDLAPLTKGMYPLLLNRFMDINQQILSIGFVDSRNGWGRFFGVDPFPYILLKSSFLQRCHCY